RILERAGNNPDQIVAAFSDEADRLNVRLLLLDNEGRIVGDSRGTLAGGGVRLQGGQPISQRSEYVWGTIQEGGQRQIFLIAPPARLPGPPRGPVQPAAYRVAV